MSWQAVWSKRLGLCLGVVLLCLLWCAPPAIALTEEQKLVAEAWRLVDRAYVDDSFNQQNWWLVRQKTLRQPLNTREQAYTAIQQMLASLDDPFTRLLKPNQYKSLQTNTAGELTGVGLQIASEPETGLLKVIAPIAGSPAEVAGVQPSDTILKIDGVGTAGLTLDEAADRMRGPIGTQVVLTVQRNGTVLSDLAIVRDRITLNPVVAELREAPVLPGAAIAPKKIGYIRLTQFNANATTEVAHAIRDLEGQGAEAYILDLRSNPGGLLQAGIDIARFWLPEGTIVYTVNRSGVMGSFDANGSALTTDPLAVLVNQGTASASEILAGALKDNHRAQIIGERTFGKGLIQSLFDLSDGSGLAVTVARYETPNHIDINKHGILPDRLVALTPEALIQPGTPADAQYQAAVDVLATQFATTPATTAVANAGAA